VELKIRRESDTVRFPLDLEPRFPVLVVLCESPAIRKSLWGQKSAWEVGYNGRESASKKVENY